SISSFCNRHLVSFSHPSSTSEIYTLSLHDALPISFLRQEQRRARIPGWRSASPFGAPRSHPAAGPRPRLEESHSWFRDPSAPHRDRKSTRLNSSHVSISYAVFCLKKKKKSIDYWKI